MAKPKQKLTVAVAAAVATKENEEKKLERARSQMNYGRSYGAKRTKEQKVIVLLGRMRAAKTAAANAQRKAA